MRTLCPAVGRQPRCRRGLVDCWQLCTLRQNAASVRFCCIFWQAPAKTRSGKMPNNVSPALGVSMSKYSNLLEKELNLTFNIFFVSIVENYQNYLPWIIRIAEIFLIDDTIKSFFFYLRINIRYISTFVVGTWNRKFLVFSWLWRVSVSGKRKFTSDMDCTS